MFRVLVVIFLAAIAYGALYHDLPCWAQVLDKTMYCQMKAGFEQEELRQAAWRKAHPHGSTLEYYLEQERRGR